jgi:hypothetical protein
MAKKVIPLRLSNQSINQTIKELEQYKRELSQKIQRFTESLALIGVKEASIRFTTAIYDGVNDVSVTLNGKGNKYTIESKGKVVAFIEFGSGVTHNTSEPYPNPRPSGIVGIGEYGEGKGKRKAWFYYGEPGDNGEVGKNGLVKTRGNPAAMPMWYATEEMKNSITQIVKEVFG